MSFFSVPPHPSHFSCLFDCCFCLFVFVFWSNYGTCTYMPCYKTRYTYNMLLKCRETLGMQTFIKANISEHARNQITFLYRRVVVFVLDRGGLTLETYWLRTGPRAEQGSWLSWIRGKWLSFRCFLPAANQKRLRITATAPALHTPSAYDNRTTCACKC